MTTRRARLRSEVMAYGDALEVAADAEALLHQQAPHPYLLVEVGRTGPSRKYLSLHPSPEAAAEYHLGQEYANDWKVDCLVDLDSGERLWPELAIRWVAVR